MWKLLYVFRVVPSPIIRSAYNCIYSICYLSHRYCYLPLSRQVAITVWQITDAVDTVVCAPDDGWRYHPKHVEQFPHINKLCNVASCWRYSRIYLRCTNPWTLKKRIFHLSMNADVTYFEFVFYVSTFVCVETIHMLGDGPYRRISLSWRWPNPINCQYVQQKIVLH